MLELARKELLDTRNQVPRYLETDLKGGQWKEVVCVSSWFVKRLRARLPSSSYISLKAAGSFNLMFIHRDYLFSNTTISTSAANAN